MPLSGRAIAALTNGKVSQRRANDVLGELSTAGVVLRDDRPPAKLYHLNRDHVAAAGISALAEQWEVLLQRIRDDLAGWSPAPVTACLFGSAARGEGGPDSDIDILLVSSDKVRSQAQAERAWQEHADSLAERVRAWSGNVCEVLDLTASDLAAAVERDDRLVRDLRRDAIALAGRDVRTLLRRRAAR
jgi:predicted nucleotidyltransferase